MGKQDERGRYALLYFDPIDDAAVALFYQKRKNNNKNSSLSYQ